MDCLCYVAIGSAIDLILHVECNARVENARVERQDSRVALNVRMCGTIPIAFSGCNVTYA